MSNPYKTIYELRETIAELSEKCREQEADIEELLKEREWISVKDRLPELYMDVLVFAKGGIIDVDCLEHIMSWGEDGFCKYGYNVTHWMPLPQKPESEDDEDVR